MGLVRARLKGQSSPDSDEEFRPTTMLCGAGRWPLHMPPPATSLQACGRPDKRIMNGTAPQVPPLTCQGEGAGGNTQRGSAPHKPAAWPAMRLQW